MYWESRIRLEVADEDTDNYGHLNNAAFPIYFERGRDDLNLKHKLHAKNLFPEGLGFLVKRASYEYNKLVTPDSEVEIRSRFMGNIGARVIVEQEMWQDGKVVARCNAEYFFTDIVKGKPIRPLIKND